MPPTCRVPGPTHIIIIIIIMIVISEFGKKHAALAIAALVPKMGDVKIAPKGNEVLTQFAEVTQSLLQLCYMHTVWDLTPVVSNVCACEHASHMLTHTHTHAHSVFRPVVPSS